MADNQSNVTDTHRSQEVEFLAELMRKAWEEFELPINEFDWLLRWYPGFLNMAVAVVEHYSSKGVLLDGPCRCGWDGKGEHLCHRCHAKLGALQFYVPTSSTAVAGSDRYAAIDSATATWACEDCWVEFNKQTKEDAK